MSNINIAKAPENYAVLPFYATAAFFFLLLSLLLFISAGELGGHYFHPRLLAIVHTATLGWGTMIIYGASYELLPVLCENDLYSSPLALCSWMVLTAGILLLVPSFWFFNTGAIMITGGALILLSALLFLFNTIRTAGSCRAYTAQKCFMISAAVWLVITASIGLLLAINLRYPFLPVNHLQILKLHAHAGIAGWFLQLVTGVSAKLIPMFLLGKSTKKGLLTTAFILQNAGLLLFMVDGFTIRALFYGLLIIAGIICWLCYLYDAFRTRMRKAIDLPMQHTALSFVCLLLSVIMIPFVWHDGKWGVLYGTLILLGWITAIILGKTFKTLPFIVWNQRYKHLNGKVNVPLPKQLYSSPLLKFQYGSYILALLTLCTGIITQHHLILQIAAGVWIVTALLYNVNVLKIIFHKR